ncbi:MAG: hypothetical protein QNJ18_19140 [Xenococcaceae cyanobacterium MO_167.B52]|nr:hypothetical protein [Xenococcaceae cyanobacterium MO_167.B52]
MFQFNSELKISPDKYQTPLIRKNPLEQPQPITKQHQTTKPSQAQQINKQHQTMNLSALTNNQTTQTLDTFAVQKKINHEPNK